MQVILCHESCRLAAGYFVQTESLAGAGPKNWNCPANCIEQMNDRDGWVIFRKPDSLESFNVWSAGRKPSREEFQQRHPKCYHCGASYPRGLVYCFDCWGVVQGGVEENIFQKRGESLRHRGDDSEIAEIKREVVLKIRRLDDPVTNPKRRGATNIRRQHPTDAFSTYCKDLYNRCIHMHPC